MFSDKIRGLVFLDEIENVKQEVARLQSRGVNKIIGLSHGGLDLDLRIAETVEGIDVIVGGHNNAFLFNGGFINTCPAELFLLYFSFTWSWNC